MSNVAQFFPIGKRLGEQVALPYNGDSFTATDGTVWKATNQSVLAYSAAYSSLLTDAPLLVTSAVALNGPFSGGTWQQWTTRGIVGSATWLMMPFNSQDYYYTSADSGSTWTQRTAPVAAKNWVSLWDGTNYVIYAQSTGATGVQESTDGVTWTARTAISIPIIDLIFANSLYVAWPSSGTACATSADRITWTSRTITTPQSVRYTQRLGHLSWNAGAALWIAGTSTNGQYQTSPDAITWTNRTSFNHIQGLNNASQIGFASNTVTTVAAGIGGSYAYSTDGLTWTAGIISSTFMSNAAPQTVFYDGTRFVVSYEGIVFYSTLGTGSWSRATRGNFINLTQPTIFRSPTGVVCLSTTGAAGLALHQTDVTSTATTNIVLPLPATDGPTRNYMRIL